MKLESLKMDQTKKLNNCDNCKIEQKEGYQIFHFCDKHIITQTSNKNGDITLKHPNGKVVHTFNLKDLIEKNKENK